MYDLVVANGRVIDPESKTDAILSLGIKDGIVQVISKEKLTGAKVIDAANCIVAPGFMDIHAHEDFGRVAISAGYIGSNLPLQTAAAQLRMGVTTMVGGNCGKGVYPFIPYLDKLKKTPLPVSYVTLIGYSVLREWLGIERYQSATPEEIDRLRGMVEEGMELGLPGVSFGLQYAPGTTGVEMLEVAKIVKRYDRFIAVHMRYDYPAKAQETVGEMLNVVKETGVKLQISHLAANVYGGDNLKRALALIETMNRQGFDVMADMYPYDAWATGIKSTVFDGEPFKIYNFSYEDIEILTGPWAGERCTPGLFKKLRERKEDTHVACHNATPWSDIEQALLSPFVFYGSDGRMTRDETTAELKGHPRGAGSAARFLRLFVRESKLMDVATALKKMTLDPANRLQLSAKGRLQPGKDADVTIFRLDQIKERAEYGINVCALPPVGIKSVIVGGKVAYTEADGIRFAADLQSKKSYQAPEGE